MNISKYLSLIVLGLMITNTYAVQTETEKDEATKSELKRDADKAVNRVKEATCMESDAECLKQKAVNRYEETKDAVKDKAKEVKDKVDD